ncbi:hypothetical protein [Corallococcus silvisoli]|uniref:hypothetical protein n=1 Tax=Corallococcus silvisoli TaxID=2697031 RepID=UPI001377CECE|nr:hypothetical protein [Corallococcus silvisoli]NBD11920.1 hypothetical protein [Corallococcus silvisoli]
MRTTRIFQGLILTLGLLAGTAHAGEVDDTSRTYVNTDVDRNRDVNVQRDVDVHRDDHRDVEVHRDVDVNVDRYHHPVARTAGAIAVGTEVRTLPSACTTVVRRNIAYQNCGGIWYQPRHTGGEMTYVVVNPP